MIVLLQVRYPSSSDGSAYIADARRLLPDGQQLQLPNCLPDEQQYTIILASGPTCQSLILWAVMADSESLRAIMGAGGLISGVLVRLD